MVFSQNTSENRVHCLNVEDSVHFFFVCKTLYKWILINFCFNTWSPFRLSCSKFQGVCCPKVFPMWPWKERRCYSQTYGTWKLSRSGVCSVDAASQLSESWCGSHFLLLVICLTKRMLGNCDSLSCLDGCIMGGGVCVFPSLHSRCRMHPEQIAVT